MNNSDEVSFVIKMPSEDVVSTETQELQKELEQMSNEMCPICGENIYKSGRCTSCPSCGWSTCSL